MTNIGAITQTAGGINLGPVFGDLQGSVAAKILSVNTNGTFTVQCYWVTTTNCFGMADFNKNTLVLRYSRNVN